MPLFQDGHRLPARAEFLVHLVLDGESVTVPARPIGAGKAGHGPGLDDEVFQDLVQRGAEVDVAVGVRRAVMEHKFLASPGGVLDFGVQVLLLPRRKDLGFPLGEVGLHGKISARQIERIFIVHD